MRPVDPADPDRCLLIRGDCDDVVEADFVSFNDDCSVGTLSGTVNEDYTLLSEVQWRLDGTVTVGDGNQTVDEPRRCAGAARQRRHAHH